MNNPMIRIKSITLFQVNLPLHKPYRLSGGRLLFEILDATLVRIETNTGLIGWGEGTPWGNTYLPAHGPGIRAASEHLAPALIGMNPCELDAINQAMDIALPGHWYAKSPFDIACWDILAQQCQLPLSTVLGANYQSDLPIASSISTDTPSNMLAEIQRYRDKGYYVHSAKIGSDVNEDIARIQHLSSHQNVGERIIYDLNRAWTPLQAIQVMNSVKNLPQACFEQPCETLAECEHLRRLTSHPISIDERLETLSDMIHIGHHQLGEIINLKVGRVGGLTKARRIRDVALDRGFHLLVMETGGSVLADTAAVHLSATIPTKQFIGTWLCQEMLSVDTAPEQGARNVNGCAVVPSTPGLGVQPDPAVIGPSIAHYQ